MARRAQKTYIAKDPATGQAVMFRASSVGKAAEVASAVVGGRVAGLRPVERSGQAVMFTAAGEALQADLFGSSGELVGRSR